MGKQQSHLRPDAARGHRALDEAPDKAVTFDDFGHAWQKSGHLWYRAFDGDGIPSWDLAQIGAGRNISPAPNPKEQNHD